MESPSFCSSVELFYLIVRVPAGLYLFYYLILDYRSDSLRHHDQSCSFTRCRWCAVLGLPHVAAPARAQRQRRVTHALAFTPRLATASHARHRWAEYRPVPTLRAARRTNIHIRTVARACPATAHFALRLPLPSAPAAHLPHALRTQRAGLARTYRHHTAYLPLPPTACQARLPAPRPLLPTGCSHSRRADSG